MYFFSFLFITKLVFNLPGLELSLSIGTWMLYLVDRKLEATTFYGSNDVSDPVY